MGDWATIAVAQPTTSAVATAVVVIVAVVVLSPRRKRFTPTWLLSALVAGAGFLISGWVGVAAVGAALSYRMFQKLRAPWQAWATMGGAVAVFALLAWLVDAAAGTVPGGIDGLDGATIPEVPLRWLAGAGVVFAGWATYRGVMAIRYPYRGMGLKIGPEHMYRGRINPHLTVLPENERDPRRAFTATERRRKLDEQGGICAFQPRAKTHPRWEPYRSGVQWQGDHVVPHAVGGATVIANLQVLCADCNSAKSSLYGADAIRAARERWREMR